jgi:hypothetical protein
MLNQGESDMSNTGTCVPVDTGTYLQAVNVLHEFHGAACRLGLEVIDGLRELPFPGGVRDEIEKIVVDALLSATGAIRESVKKTLGDSISVDLDDPFIQRYADGESVGTVLLAHQIDRLLS